MAASDVLRRVLRNDVGDRQARDDEQVLVAAAGAGHVWIGLGQQHVDAGAEKAEALLTELRERTLEGRR